MPANRVSATRRIAATASALYAIVSTPSGHVRIDGSGMLHTTPDAGPLTAVGQTFDMRMDRTPLHDIPGLVEYVVRNTVTQIVPNRLVEWTVGLGDAPPFMHVYGWQLEPVSDTETNVTNYCDWTNISEELRATSQWPVVPVEMLEESIAKLARLVTD
jgi:hypothetical protein